MNIVYTASLHYYTAIDGEPKFPTDVQAILSVTDDFLLTACSSSTRIPSLQLVDVKSGDFVKIPLSKTAPIYEPEPIVKILPAQLPPDEIMPPSIYIAPQREGKIPLIVLPHGGPHGVLSDTFDHDTAYFTKLGNLPIEHDCRTGMIDCSSHFSGFGFFKVNYTGSTGTRFDSTRNLNGHISKLDVPQVHQLVIELVESNPNIDSKRVFLCGGSHGGFIVLHLSSQYPVTLAIIFAYKKSKFPLIPPAGILQRRCGEKSSDRFESKYWNH